MSGGSHTAVLLEQAVEGLKVRSDGCYVDCTFGRGGHSRLILAQLGDAGRLLALDRDPQAVAAGGEIDDRRFHILHGRFSRLAALAAQAGVTAADGVLLDLGVASPQLDDPARGFSFRFDAPLDMRMDPGAGLTAAAWLARAPEREIREVIRNYGEERFAKSIAASIVAARARGPVGTTRELAALVAKAVPAREPQQDPATRTFQAIRIHLNQELEELSLALPQCLELLRPGGRLVVISFHSLEDRIVKRFLRDNARADRLPPRLPLRADELPRPPLKLIGRPVRPAAVEVAANPRARSAVMRIAEKLAVADRD
ncbi:MAG TPA: 16S rRNA (cytosine(1402)-N(4))-methyltransferase RsmH [Burkholderiales bacterium]